MNDDNLKLAFYIDKPTSRNKKYFIYQGGKYLIDFDLLILNSNFFYKNRQIYENLENIPLLNDNESKIDLPKESIQTFIASCQNQPCQISRSSVIPLQYLSTKYEYPALTEITNKFIEENSEKLIFESIQFKKELKEKVGLSNCDTTKEEEVISKNFNRFIKDDRMLLLPIPFLDRIIQRIDQNNSKIKNNEMIDFLFKTLDKYGKEASILFSYVDFENEKINVVNRLLKEYSERFDFNMINSTLLKTTTELTSELTKQKEEYKQLFVEMKREFENQKQCIDEIKEREEKREKEEIKLHQEKEKIYNEEMKEIKMKYEEEINQIKSKTEKEINQIKKQFCDLLEKQKQMFQTETIKEYHQYLYKILSYEKAKQNSEESANNFINEVIRNEKEFSNSSDKTNRLILFNHKLFDKLIKEDKKENIQSFFKQNHQTKINFIKENIKNNMNDFSMKFNMIDHLYQTNDLMSTLVDINQILDSFTIEINYPSDSYQPIMNIIYDFKKQFNVYSKSKIIIINVYRNENAFKQYDENDLIYIFKKSFFDFDEVSTNDMINLFIKLYKSEIREYKDMLQYCTFLELFTFPPYITSIGVKAFNNFKNLKKIKIPDSITSIGRESFSHCNYLTEISIMSSIKSIEYSSFEYCSSLKRVNLPSSLTSIESCSFQFCSSLTEITIPSSVVSIKSCAFRYCRSLVKIMIPSSVTSIESYAFEECNSLINLIFEEPSSLNSIDEKAFKCCKSLTHVSIPSSVRSIGKEAFKECSSLMQVSFGKGSSISTIEEFTFSSCSSLTQFSVPSSVSSIGRYSFSQCSLLSRISIPPSVNSIGEGAFSHCYSLTHISIPSSSCTFGSNTFEYCCLLSEIETPSSINSEKIGINWNVKIKKI